ncbi:MAG: MoaD/ThiS family protein [Candidatus Jordarchaeum sp.]|uniref:MoaD/ThiS family protein n=1 Tax=Candidatus Jordarchaeum sp. TaxID=2823881 RepID=UPI00404B8107
MKVSVRAMSTLKYTAKKSKMLFTIENGATVRSLLNLIREVDEKLYNAISVNEGQLNPGIIVLINERDMELLQGIDTKLQDGDVVVFLSAVHGGNMVSSDRNF